MIEMRNLIDRNHENKHVLRWENTMDEMKSTIQNINSGLDQAEESMKQKTSHLKLFGQGAMKKSYKSL